ncbi:MAG: helix-turn-helix protein [Firmicutes bacterium]|nr:helix-turn-helix protein [Bacillota bacterium]
MIDKTINKKLGDYVRNKRGEISLRDFAKNCGISHTHLDSIEKGYDPRSGKPVSPNIEVLRKIAKGIGIPFGEFLTETGFLENDYFKFEGNFNYHNKDEIWQLIVDSLKDKIDDTDLKSLKEFSFQIYLKNLFELKNHLKDLPIYGDIKITAHGYNLIDYIDTKKWIIEDENTFMLKVNSDNMYPRLFPGDFVIVSPQDNVSNGDIALVIIDKQYLIRRYRTLPNGIILQADNTLYPDIELYGENVSKAKVIGKVIDIKVGRI